MCNPALAVMAISAAVTVAGQQQKGKQAAAMGDYQNKQAQADANAQRSEAELRADNIRKRARVVASSANAASAASGVTVGEGSALAIQKDIYGEAENDAQMTIFGGADAAARTTQEGAAMKITGDNKRTAANWESASTVMSAASSGYSKWKGQ